MKTAPLAPLENSLAPQAKTTPPAGNNTTTFLQTWLDELNIMFENFSELVPELDNTVLDTTERRRLLGSGVRRYGHIEKVFEVSQEFPQFWPAFVGDESLGKRVREIDALRNLTILFQFYARVTGDMLLLAGHDAFRMANSYYTTVRDAARRGGTPEAAQVFERLQLFWRRPRRANSEPTEKELLHDFNQLLHGKADGTMAIENESPHMTGGMREVVDHVSRAKRRASAKIKEQIEE